MENNCLMPVLCSCVLSRLSHRSRRDVDYLLWHLFSAQIMNTQAERQVCVNKASQTEHFYFIVKKCPGAGIALRLKLEWNSVYRISRKKSPQLT